MRLKINRIELVIAIRPIEFLFIGNWYSMYRFIHPVECESGIGRFIDLGVITIGYWNIK